MINYHYIVEVKDRRSGTVLHSKRFEIQEKADAMAFVASINADTFSDRYATIETIAEGRDVLAEQCHEFIAKRMNNWHGRF